jgi:hypothetical protein
MLSQLLKPSICRAAAARALSSALVRPAAAGLAPPAPLALPAPQPYGSSAAACGGPFGSFASRGTATQAPAAAAAPAADTTLFARLGGDAALDATLTRFYGGMVVDPFLAPFFEVCARSCSAMRGAWPCAIRARGLTCACLAAPLATRRARTWRS